MGTQGLISPLAQQRARRDITQQELADRAGVSRLTIVRMEGDPDRRPHLRTIYKLAEVLGCGVEDIAPWLEVA